MERKIHNASRNDPLIITEVNSKPEVEEKLVYYCNFRTKTVKIIYISIIIFWIFIICYFKLFKYDDIVACFILLVPILIFVSGYFSSEKLEMSIENDVFQTNYLNLGLLIAIPLLSWISKDYKGDRQKFIAILVMSLILSMMSMVDIWMRSKWMSAVKHFKSGLQTMSIVLLIFALYSYYIEIPHLLFVE